MGTISISLPSDGSAASVSQYNTPITTIVNALNGNLDSSNISSVSGTKVTAGTLPGTALDANTAGGWTAMSQTLTYGANNGSKEFTVTASSDLTGFLSPGMKLKLSRGTTPPTQCMAFTSASSQYATKSSPTGISFTSAFTCEAWVYLNSYTGVTQCIVSRTDATSSGWIFAVNATGQLFVEYGSSGSFTTLTSYQSIPLNTWVHVAGVITSVASKTGAIYLNATSIPSSLTLSSATTLTQSGNLSVGAYNTGTANTFFNGYISETRVWSAANSQASIQSNMAISLTGSETNLVALFQGNGNFNDATSNANNLTAQAGAIATQAANPYNATEYTNIRAISYSNPTTTITLYTSDAGTIPNMTLNTPFYSVVKEPYGLPEVLNSKVLGQVIWCTNVTTTATATGTLFNGSPITLTVPTGGKKLVLKFYCNNVVAGSGVPVLDVYWGSTQLQRWQGLSGSAGQAATPITAPFWASSGSQTFQVDMWETVAGTCTAAPGTTAIAWFTVEEA
jgi:hypothetical protein